MKVICNRGALLEALNITGNAVAVRTPKPVLQCVKLTAEDNRITLAATALRNRGLVRYARGNIEILDCETLAAVACPCYASTMKFYARLLGARRRTE